MCQVILSPLGSTEIPLERLQVAWDNNSDGAGYMFVANNCIVIRKPFYKLKSLLHRYALDFAQYGQSSPFVIHFRIATHGSQSPQNTHPHSVIRGEVALAHNGILPTDPLQGGDDRSDTVQFIDKYFRKASKEWLMSVETNEYLSETLGWNKLVLMDREGRVSIINEACGKWVGDHWFSNDPDITRAMYRGYPIGTTPYTGTTNDPWEGYQDLDADLTQAASVVNEPRSVTDNLFAECDRKEEIEKWAGFSKDEWRYRQDLQEADNE